MRLFKDIKQLIFLNSFINRPVFFNSLRYLVTGSQLSLKEFVRDSLMIYNCRSVLDVCCGTGDFVQRNHINYVGIDINPHFISFAQKKYGNNKIRFIEGNALSLPFAQRQFDASLLISTLHHFPNLEARKLLLEVKRVTKKIVIIVDLTPDPSNYLKRFLVILDQGNFVRPVKEKEKIVSQFFEIKSTHRLFAGLAEQYGIIAKA